MAITLPDFTALPTVTPQAGGNLLQYPQNDAGAVALGELGKGAQAAGGALVDIAAYRDIAQTKMDRASADADFTNAITPITEQLKNETDPEKITALRGQYQAALESAAGNFTNPQARDFWMKGHAGTVAKGAAAADERNSEVYRDQGKAGMLGKLNDSIRTGSAGEDPLSYANSLHNIDQLTHNGRLSGWLSAVEEQQLNAKSKSEMAAGRIDTLRARGQYDEASAVLKANRTDIGAERAGNFEAQIARDRENAGIKRDIDAEMGPGKGYTTPRPGGGATGGPIAGETQETLQADYAKRSGAFGTPEQAGNNLTTVTAPGGAAFRVHKLAAPQIQGFVNELEQNGYKIDPATSGGYNNRNKVGVNTSEKSEHAFGTAFDINTDRNKQADTLITDLPANVGEIAAKWGLKWGGTFTGKKDAMHFEVARLAGAPAAPGAGPTATAQAPDRVDNWEARNNNFGGIRKQGADPNATTAEGGFEAYPTPEAGVQAIADNLRRYAAGGVVTEMNPDGKPLNTIRGIVSTWAPPSQNDTNALIGRASRSTGFKPDQPIDLKDPATMAKVIEATVRNEFGGKLPVAPAIIAKVAGGAAPLAAGSSSGPAVAPAGAGGEAGPAAPAAPPAGQLEPGNIDLDARPVIKNPDGSISTVASISINEDGKEVLIPTVAADGSRVLTNEEAIKQYHDTGQHLGKFDNVDNANAAAEALHLAQAQQYAPATGEPIPLDQPGAAAAGAPAAPPVAGPGALSPHIDINAKEQRWQDRADRGEISQAHADAVIAGMRQRYNHIQATEAQDRATILKQAQNGAAMLADGRDFEYDPAVYRHYFPKDKAEEIIQTLDDATQAGQMISTVKDASPDQIIARRATLQQAMQDPAAPDYIRKKKLAEVFESVVTKRNEQILKDPGAYVRQNSPAVNQAYAGYLTALKEPPVITNPPISANEAALHHAKAFADYAQATLAEQARLGVPEAQRAILPKAEAADLASKIAGIDPAKQSPVAEMRRLALGYGSGLGTNDYWPQVFGELVKHKLPGAYQLLASMDRPDQAVAADDLSRALGLVAQKGGMAAVKEGAAGVERKGLEDALDSELQEFKLSTGLQTGGEHLYATVKDGVRVLGDYYMYRGQSQNEAVRHAVDGIIRNKYDFGQLGQTDVRVPKGTLSDVSRAAEALKGSVTPDELGAVPIRNPEVAGVMTPDQAKAIWMDAIRNGGWANNEDDSGLVLMGKFRDGSEYAVRRSDGSRIVLTFDHVPAIVGARPMPAPMNPEDIGARPGIR